MSEAGLAAVGVHLPRQVATAETIGDAWDGFEARGIEQVTVTAGDEDALTMGVAAGRRALAAADLGAGDLESLAFATTNPPLEESELTARLGSALGVPDGAARRTVAGSTRAGTAVLGAALDAGRTPTLVVAADCPRGEPDDAHEHAAGAGAAALVLTDGGPVAVTDRGTVTRTAPGTRFRRRGSDVIEGTGVRQYDRDAFVETVAGAVAALDERPAASAAVSAAAIQSPDGDLPYRAGRRCDLDAETIAAGTVVDRCGDVGTASVPLGLAAALVDGHESILAVGYGSGGVADALVLAGECPVATNRTIVRDEAATNGTEKLEYPALLRERGEITPGEPAGGGAYVSLPSWRRSLPQRHRLIAGRCPECGALAYPPAGACRDCQALVGYERVELSRKGVVETATTISQGGAPPEFTELQARSGELQVILAAFEVEGENESESETKSESEGDRVTVPLQGIAEAEPVAHGDRVRAVLRRLYTQEGVPRYARKASPL